jgi:serine/threonine protein kinase
VAPSGRQDYQYARVTGRREPPQDTEVDRDTVPPDVTLDFPTLDARLEDDVAIEDPTRALPADRYRAGTMIARGGMGEVIAAIDTQIGREVAIKRMRRDTPSSTLRFMREARIQGRLEHPAIVPVHELSHDRDGNPFFVMKRLSGTTLAEILDRIHAGDRDAVARFPRHRLLRAFVDACLAIEFAHSRNVIHRDLKPENIMLGDFGEVYVLDWGVARVIEPESGDRPIDVDFDSETQVGSILGTPGYIPPEQITGGIELDGRVDVFALGAILFELLAGEPLLPRGPAALTAIFGRFDARPSERSGDRSIPPELDAACVAATIPDVADRTQTARALAEQVERYLDGDRAGAVTRRRIAEHLDAAHRALARDDSDSRRVAIQAAGRALALDPDAHEAAGLVSQLLHSAPRTTPREIVAELDTIDRAMTRTSARREALATLAYLLFVPIMATIGVHEPWQLGALAGLAGMTSALAISSAFRRGPRVLGPAAVIANAAMIGFLGWLVSPFVIAPGVAVVTVMAFAFRPSPRRFLPCAVITACGVLAPWLLAQTGTIEPAPVVTDPTGVGLAAYVIFVLALGAYLGRAAANAQRDVRHGLQRQAWDLRQILGPDR